jgi:hypothetical protein
LFPIFLLLFFFFSFFFLSFLFLSSFSPSPAEALCDTSSISLSLSLDQGVRGGVSASPVNTRRLRRGGSPPLRPAGGVVRRPKQRVTGNSSVTGDWACGDGTRQSRSVRVAAQSQRPSNSGSYSGSISSGEFAVSL